MAQRTTVIFGHGRSGTKILQLIAAYVMADDGRALDFYYEPLMWCGYKTWWPNRGAMRVHHSMPLCWTEEAALNQRACDFFESLKSERPANVLVKFIRMTGRSRLLHERFPEVRKFFLYRHPVGVINSLLNVRFSLLGPPFYKSDLPRLIEECRRQEIVAQNQINEMLPYPWGGELLYWFATHVVAVQDLQQRDTTVLSYERLIESKEDILRQVCRLLGAEYKETYHQLYDISVLSLRLLDRILVPRCGSVLRHRLALLGDVVRQSIHGLPLPQQFQGVNSLDRAPRQIKPFRRLPKKKQKLSEKEVAFVTNLTAPLLAQLDALERRGLPSLS